jgi:cytidylate kinase
MSKIIDKSFQIAIDGPCAVGKTTIAKKIAEKLSFLLINTGNMYRCYALVLKQKKSNLENENEILDVLNSSKVDLDNGK